jgi:hypothetical protein
LKLHGTGVIAVARNLTQHGRLCLAVHRSRRRGAIGCGLRSRHDDAEDGAAPRGVLGLHPPVVSLGDGMHDRETQP